MLLWGRSTSAGECSTLPGLVRRWRAEVIVEPHQATATKLRPTDTAEAAPQFPICDAADIISSEFGIAPQAAIENLGECPANDAVAVEQELADKLAHAGRNDLAGPLQ